MRPHDVRLSILIPARDETACIGAVLADLAPLRAAGHEVILIDGEVFTGIHWSSPRVLDQTRAALRRAGSRRRELPTLRDLDLPEDLDALADLSDAGNPV